MVGLTVGGKRARVESPAGCAFVAVRVGVHGHGWCIHSLGAAAGYPPPLKKLISKNFMNAIRSASL